MQYTSHMIQTKTRDHFTYYHWWEFISICRDRNIGYNFHGSRSKAKAISFQSISPFIFPSQSLWILVACSNLNCTLESFIWDHKWMNEIHHHLFKSICSFLQYRKHLLSLKTILPTIFIIERFEDYLELRIVHAPLEITSKVPFNKRIV